MWWTAPLYAVFVLAGLYAADFALTPVLELLLGVLAAFGFLDALVLVRITSIRARPIESVEEMQSAQRQIERLSRTLLIGGGAFGAAFLAGVVMMAFL